MTETIDTLKRKHRELIERAEEARATVTQAKQREHGSRAAARQVALSMRERFGEAFDKAMGESSDDDAASVLAACESLLALTRKRAASLLAASSSAIDRAAAAVERAEAEGRAR